jgi:hypothetical protein
VNLIPTPLLARDPSTDGVIVYLTVANAGGAAAGNVQVTAAAIGTTAAATALPITLGTTAPGATAIARIPLAGPVGASGSRVILRVKGTYTGGQLGAQYRLTLP